ncbi:MAG: right-handed parallel beta-helix repeat-containing protein [Dehalococcoidia bacterium]|nr:right-handed parallel beta-helix repeat-containing protein [Dehalococcoidia bacterium]
MRISRTVALALFAAAGATTLVAGPLDPPAGPISSTYKTLTEVEPRIAITATNTPGDADSLFRITQPGSYYLTGNVQGVAGRHGIEIAARNVSIDLMGFGVLGVPGSLDGVRTDGALDSISVRNGSVSNWGGDGVDLVSAGPGTGAVVEGVQSSGNASNGIAVALGAVIRACTAAGNGQDGIRASSNAAIEACSARGNGGVGILADNASTVARCTATLNATGIIALSSTVVSECSSDSNTFHGIYADVNVSILGCNAASNGENGIVFVSQCVVRGNTCNSNGTAIADGAGLFTGGVNNHVENNTCIANDIGVRCQGFLNFITRNTGASNTAANWDVAANNKCLVVGATSAPAIFGNAGGTGPGSTDPNANFSY